MKTINQVLKTIVNDIEKKSGKEVDKNVKLKIEKKIKQGK